HDPPQPGTVEHPAGDEDAARERWIVGEEGRLQGQPDGREPVDAHVAPAPGTRSGDDLSPPITVHVAGRDPDAAREGGMVGKEAAALGYAEGAQLEHPEQGGRPAPGPVTIWGGKAVPEAARRHVDAAREVAS